MAWQSVRDSVTSPAASPASRPARLPPEQPQFGQSGDAHHLDLGGATARSATANALNTALAANRAASPCTWSTLAQWQAAPAPKTRSDTGRRTARTELAMSSTGTSQPTRIRKPGGICSVIAAPPSPTRVPACPPKRPSPPAPHPNPRTHRVRYPASRWERVVRQGPSRQVQRDVTQRDVGADLDLEPIRPDRNAVARSTDGDCPGRGWSPDTLADRPACGATNGRRCRRPPGRRIRTRPRDPELAGDLVVEPRPC